MNSDNDSDYDDVTTTTSKTTNEDVIVWQTKKLSRFFKTLRKRIINHNSKHKKDDQINFYMDYDQDVDFFINGNE